MRRTFDTEALAASFPFAAADPPLDPNGVLYGLAAAGAPVVLDRFARDNYNSVLLARSGAGKSYLAKLEALRLLYAGVQVFVIDPEDEYRRLCQAVGGVYLPLAGADAVTLNPLDLPAGGDRQTLDERRSSSPSWSSCCSAGWQLRSCRRSTAPIRACYSGAGISDDPATHSRPAPLLRDLAARSPPTAGDGARLAERLEPYATGSHASAVRAREPAQPDGQLVCFSLRGLPERLKAPALLLALDAIWRSLEGPLRKRCVLVDEAWLLMREPAGATLPLPARQERPQTLVRPDRRSPRTPATCSPPSSASGRSRTPPARCCCARRRRRSTGSATRSSSPPARRRYLLTCPTGQRPAADQAARNACRSRVVASPTEHRLVTSDPAELAELERRSER